MVRQAHHNPEPVEGLMVRQAHHNPEPVEGLMSYVVTGAATAIGQIPDFGDLLASKVIFLN